MHRGMEKIKHASVYALSESKLATVSCLRFEAAVAVERVFCVPCDVVQENNNTHVLPMILSDPPHLQYHDCQV
jgi:hypothetical protein